jgi:hypothetical protein
LWVNNLPLQSNQSGMEFLPSATTPRNRNSKMYGHKGLCKNWRFQQLLVGSDCTRIGRVVDLYAAINAFTDVLFAVIPIPMIWTLKINFRTKISLIGILSLGFL